MLPMMPGSTTPIQPLPINLLLGTLGFYIIARIYVLPKIGVIEPKALLLPILLLHSFRHLGLMSLASGATYPGLPPGFAYPEALGDLVAAALAFVTIPLVISNHPAARPMLWLFTIQGALDLVLAVGLGVALNAAPFMGPSYWIPALIVPALLVSHYVTVLILLRGGTETRKAY